MVNKKKYIGLSSFRLLEPVKTPEKDPVEYALATIVLLFDQNLKISHFRSCYDTITTVVERFLWLFRAATRPPYFEDSTGRVFWLFSMVWKKRLLYIHKSGEIMFVIKNVKFFNQSSTQIWLEFELNQIVDSGSLHLNSSNLVFIVSCFTPTWHKTKI
jgi:hypothetical protein